VVDVPLVNAASSASAASSVTVSVLMSESTHVVSSVPFTSSHVHWQCANATSSPHETGHTICGATRSDEQATERMSWTTTHTN
jgi:hypothetical protein